MISPAAWNGPAAAPATTQHFPDVSDPEPILRNAVPATHPFHSQATACNIGTTG